MVHMSSSWCHGNPPGPQLWPLSLAPEHLRSPVCPPGAPPTPGSLVPLCPPGAPPTPSSLVPSLSTRGPSHAQLPV
ncbi:unnamed protein product [Arctogadus glacialis]